MALVLCPVALLSKARAEATLFGAPAASQIIAIFFDVCVGDSTWGAAAKRVQTTNVELLHQYDAPYLQFGVYASFNGNDLKSGVGVAGQIKRDVEQTRFNSCEASSNLPYGEFKAAFKDKLYMDSISCSGMPMGKGLVQTMSVKHNGEIFKLQISCVSFSDSEEGITLKSTPNAEAN